VYINIYGDGASNTIIDCQNDGYGFELHSGTFYIYDITIQNCVKNVSVPISGNFSGGAAVAVTSTDTELHNVRLINNYAKGLGGAIFAKSTTVFLYNTEISGDQTNLYGGGIYTQSADFEIYNSTIIGNSDRTGKNDILCISASVNLYGNSSVDKVFCEACSITKNQQSLCQGRDDQSAAASTYVTLVILVISSLLTVMM